jgi:hypothetical protein
MMSWLGVSGLWVAKVFFCFGCVFMGLFLDCCCCVVVVRCAKPRL